MTKFILSTILILSIFVAFPYLYLSIESDSKEYQNQINSKKKEKLKEAKKHLTYLSEKYGNEETIDLNECFKRILDIYTDNNLLQIYYFEKNGTMISQFPEHYEDGFSLSQNSKNETQKPFFNYDHDTEDEIFYTKNNFLYRLGITLNHPSQFLDIIKEKTFGLKFSIIMIFLSSLIVFSIYYTSFSIDKKLYYKLSRTVERPFYFKFMQLVEPKSATHSGILALNTANRNKEEINRQLQIDIPKQLFKDLLDNKTQLPVVFNGIISGPDINRYSAFKDKEAEVIDEATGEKRLLSALSVISSKLIQIASECLLRYGGRFATSQGDNAVSMFENENKELLSFSYCRDLMDLFSQIDFLIDGKNNRFTLKSSLVNGTLKFEKLMGSPAVSSNSFTEFNRLLSSVFENEKDQNVFVLEKSYLTAVESLILEKSDLHTRTGKNLPHPLYVYLITKVKNIKEIYTSDFDKIHFFRSDFDIIFLLKKLRTESDVDKIEYIIKGFSLFKTNIIPKNLVEEWICTLNFLNSEAKSNRISWKILSYYIKTAQNLISQTYFTSDIIEALFLVDNLSDDRTVASVASVLNHFERYEQILDNKSWFFNSKHIESKRIRNEFLVCDALKNLGERSLKNIRCLLNSKNILDQKSGLYAAYTVIEHHLQYNIEALYVMAEYGKIVKKVEKIKPEALNDRMKGFRSEILKSYNRVFKNISVDNN